jgi:hypothetical protein
MEANMTAASIHKSYRVADTTDRNLLVGAAFLLAFFCCALFATLAPSSTAASDAAIWTFFP